MGGMKVKLFRETADDVVGEGRSWQKLEIRTFENDNSF